MKPHEYRTAYQIAHAKGDVERWYRTMALPIIACGDRKDSAATLAQSEVETNWLLDRRPYYTVYPVAAEALRRVELSIGCDNLQLPLRSLLIRFGVGQEPICNREKLRSILVGKLPTNWAEKTKFGEGPDYSVHPGLSCWMDFGEITHEFADRLKFEIPIYKYVQFPLVPGKSVEEIISTVPHYNPEENTCIEEALRFVMGLCLLANDPEVIKPDVLDRDRIKYEEKPDQTIVDRAHRRGKVGWLVGADWEMIPHYRRPHFALRWTGEGRKVAKIVPVKGAVVHRSKLTDVPEGYLG